MSSKKKQRKIRTEFRKHHNTRARGGDITRQYAREDLEKQEYSREISFSGDSKMLAVGGVVGVFVVNVETDQVVFSGSIENRECRAISLDYTGSKVAALNDKGIIFIWDIINVPLKSKTVL